ncbi:MAG TPA: phosphatidate cytidylyltransferase [Acidimicrobiales bacterium]|jgi:CDP-diglyceride synthetase|nr:phosphatidate cytidylyltransferase [Acidimicrobiales bacterium]
MTDYTDDEDGTEGIGRSDGTGGSGGIDEDPPSYRSGRVRIIGAEPAGNAMREVTGPVVEDIPDMPHWNDAPTGQVPAILDRGTGEEQALAPPTWREEDTDWAAHEELFEPSMLSDDQPAVGSLVNDNNEQVDMERQPWHFEPDPPRNQPGDDETLIYEPGREREPEYEPLPPLKPAVPEPFAPAAPSAAADDHVSATPRGATRVSSSSGSLGGPAAAARLVPPAPPQARVRTPRASRLREDARNSNGGGTAGRDMRVAIGSGVLLGLVALACFKAGTLASMVIVSAVVLLAVAEAFAAFRKAQYHPATLLGLVATLSLMIETYNKGFSALPLVMVMLVAATFVWFLARVEPAAEPVNGLASTVFVFTWVGGLGSFAALLLSPSLFPHRHGIAFLLAAVLTTVAADVAALLVGSAMGRHPMAPSISPNKSWEGFFGGALASVLMAVVVVHFIHPWTIGKALVLGLVVAVVAPLGDLSQSMIKRHLGVKDMGRLMPGHGGILDRVDGLLFVLPATYFVVKALHLG